MIRYLVCLWNTAWMACWRLTLRVRPVRRAVVRRLGLYGYGESAAPPSPQNSASSTGTARIAG